MIIAIYETNYLNINSATFTIKTAVLFWLGEKL